MVKKNMATDYQEYFTTPDYWLTGALLAMGKKLMRLDWEGKRAYFVLSDLTGCNELVQAYWAGDLKVGARIYADSLRTLKDRIFNRDTGHVYGNENARKYQGQTHK